MNMKNKENSDYFFLNTDVGLNLTGIERSAFLRANVFVEKLAIIPYFVTINYNKKIRENWNRVIQSGLVSSQVKMVNLYDWFQKTEEGKEMPSFELQKYPYYSYEKVPVNQDHIRVSNEKNELIQYIAYDNGKLNYINYFQKGNKIQRDLFNNYGQLSHRHFLNSKNESIKTDYFDVYGRLVLSIEADKILFYDPKFHTIKHLFTEMDELIIYFLEKIVTKQKENHFIVDRNSSYNKALKEYKRFDAKIYPVIHSTHFAVANEEHGKINSHYKDIFNAPYLFDKIITLTQKQKEDIQERFAIDNLITIPHPYNEKLKIAENQKKNSKKLVSLARLAPEKQFDKMVEVIKHVSKEIPDIKLEIYGNGAEKNKIQELINEYELQKNITLHPYQENIKEIYEDAALSLFTGRAEGFCLSIQESLALGCPVASFDIKYGPADMIKPEYNGFLIEPNNIEQFATKIIQFIKKDQQQEFSKNCLKEIQRFSEQNVALEWEKLFKESN